MLGKLRYYIGVQSIFAVPLPKENKNINATMGTEAEECHYDTECQENKEGPPVLNDDDDDLNNGDEQLSLSSEISMPIFRIDHLRPLATEPAYRRLLETATPQLMREFPMKDQFTSNRSCFSASLLSTLYAHCNPMNLIPQTLPTLLRPVLAALPGALDPPSG